MSGVFGVCFDKDCLEELKRGSSVLQHRGDEWAGFSILKGNKIETVSGKGKITPLLKDKTEETQTAITCLSQRDPQPVALEETRMGPLSLVFDGKIINREEVFEKFPYLSGTDAEILIRLIGQGKDILDGLKKVYQIIKGPFSLILLSREGIFTARDTFGIRPLILGRFFEDGVVGCAVASESISLEHIGMKMIRDVKPGEIVKIETTGFRSLDQIFSPGLIICSFEYAYWARPSSIIENIPVGLSRYNAGINLVSDCPSVDFIAGIPMSGNTAAEGFHFASKVPYRSIFDFNIEAGGRSFIPLSSLQRAKRARNKLLIMNWAVNDYRILIVDDSIVEGNQTLSRIFLIKKAGAKEVHLRIASPKMKYSCPFDSTSRGELMASTHSEEEMRKKLGLESLSFNSIEGFEEAIISSQNKRKNPIKPENLCLGCFKGIFPEY